MPRLAYIGQIPTHGTGSPVILLRHLRRLAAKGWEITIIGEHGQDASACEAAGWRVKQLPLRRPWWPPFRNDQALSRKMRTWLLGRECASLMGDRPDALLGYLAAHADFFPEIAAQFARQSRRPLSLLIHDDAAAFAQDDAERSALRLRHRWILRQAHRTWFVSPELALAYDVPDSARRVLLPIPEGWERPATWQENRAGRPRVYYAGFIWPPQYPLLARLAQALDRVGARLVLLTRETPELKSFLEREPADWVAPFRTNHEALEHLVAQAAGVIVSYTDSVAEMAWIATSFPSKFIEYSHLGLPTAIVAPRDSSIGQWATRNHYAYAFAPAEGLDGFSAWAAGLKVRDSWQRSATVTAHLAQGPFNPETIQREFEEGLLK